MADNILPDLSVGNTRKTNPAVSIAPFALGQEVIHG